MNAHTKIGNVTLMPREGCGVEILGVDLNDLSDADWNTIRETHAQNGLIFFRDQKLTPEEHIAFAKRWGEIDVNKFFPHVPGYREIALVSKEKEQKTNIGGGWHTDHSYDQIPAMGSILVARTLPPEGGDTIFANMYAAYDALDDETKAEIADLEAVHSNSHVFGSKAYYNNEERKEFAKDEAVGKAVHPVVITHPLSGKKALYVNPGFTVAFEGKTPEDSKPLLYKLFAHAMKPEFHTRFQWRDGSIAFWDNRATWHFALNDYHGHERFMHRITIAGCALN
ncbi:MAG TPA: TauD/TfdA family dioxygenase [Rhizomicrobium sp.]|jgi:taurine dioxygenase|nr:TauD/TfdA family dioxygenase [Rhizomicrobium sp.]